MWRKYFSLSRLKNTFDYWQHQEQYRVLWKERLTYSQDGLHSFHSAAFMQEPRFREAYELGKKADGGILLRNRIEIHWRVYVLCWAATQILDDYGYGNNQEQKWAHDTWAASKQIKILSLPTGQGLIMKSQASDDGKAAA